MTYLFLSENTCCVKLLLSAFRIVLSLQLAELFTFLHMSPPASTMLNFYFRNSNVINYTQLAGSPLLIYR